MRTCLVLFSRPFPRGFDSHLVHLLIKYFPNYLTMETKDKEIRLNFLPPYTYKLVKQELLTPYRCPKLSPPTLQPTGVDSKTRVV